MSVTEAEETAIKVTDEVWFVSDGFVSNSQVTHINSVNGMVSLYGYERKHLTQCYRTQEECEDAVTRMSKPVRIQPFFSCGCEWGRPCGCQV